MSCPTRSDPRTVARGREHWTRSAGPKTCPDLGVSRIWLVSASVCASNASAVHKRGHKRRGPGTMTMHNDVEYCRRKCIIKRITKRISLRIKRISKQQNPRSAKCIIKRIKCIRRASQRGGT